MNLVKLIFSYDRPLQLWGLVRSILDNTDLAAQQIRCICRSSDWRYHRAYDVIGADLGCQIIHENKVYRGINYRWVDRLFRKPRKLVIYWWLNRLISKQSLCELILTQAETTDFVSFAVDDMVYFRKASFDQAIDILREEPEICLWSWRIGWDLQPHDSLQVEEKHWIVPHGTTVMPYRYVFHTDGSIFRRRDLEYWLGLIPEDGRKTFNLNQIEGYLARYSEAKRDALRIGKLHAGPLRQACTTWQINKVSRSGGAGFCETTFTNTAHLLRIFEAGARLDYSPLYHRSDWLVQCNENWGRYPTHVAPTEQASQLWAQLIKNPKDPIVESSR